MPVSLGLQGLSYPRLSFRPGNRCHRRALGLCQWLHGRTLAAPWTLRAAVQDDVNENRYTDHLHVGKTHGKPKPESPKYAEWTKCCDKITDNLWNPVA